MAVAGELVYAPNTYVLTGREGDEPAANWVRTQMGLWLPTELLAGPLDVSSIPTDAQTNAHRHHRNLVQRQLPALYQLQISVERGAAAAAQYAQYAQYVLTGTLQSKGLLSHLFRCLAVV